MLADGIIEESDSLWCSPPIPVKKKDLSSRSHSVTVYDPFYMPLTEEVIARLGYAQFQTKQLDIARGFIRLQDDSKDFKTFSCKFGKYGYLRMLFGTKNALSTYQVMMQRCLHLEAFSSPYMDDVIIFSQTWPDHLLIFLKCCPA